MSPLSVVLDFLVGYNVLYWIGYADYQRRKHKELDKIGEEILLLRIELKNDLVDDVVELDRRFLDVQQRLQACRDARRGYSHASEFIPYWSDRVRDVRELGRKTIQWCTKKHTRTI